VQGTHERHDQRYGLSQRVFTLEPMSVTVELPEEALARLRAEAARRQISLDQLITELAAALPAETDPTPRRKLAFVGIGSSTSGRSARDADEMLAEGFGRD